MITSTTYLVTGAVLVFLSLTEALKNAVKHTPDINVRRSLKIYATWLAFSCALGNSGVLADFSTVPPKMMLMLAGIFLTSILFAFSKTGTRVAMLTPLWALVGFQGFRLLAELELDAGYHEGIFPIQMTFEGYNFDVVTAIVALMLIPILRRSPNNNKIAWAFNIVGILLLANILVIAILSMPTPFRQFMNEPANAAVAGLPHILLPACLVQGAIVGHLLLTRRLLQTRPIPR